MELPDRADGSRRDVVRMRLGKVNQLLLLRVVADVYREEYCSQIYRVVEYSQGEHLRDMTQESVVGSYTRIEMVTPNTIEEEQYLTSDSLLPGTTQ